MNNTNDDYNDENDSGDDSSELGPLSRLEEFIAPASRRRFMGNAATVGGVLALAGAGAGTAAAGGSEEGSSGHDDGESTTIEGFTTKTNGPNPGTGGFEEYGDRPFTIAPVEEGADVPQKVKIACEGEERKKYRNYEIVYQVDDDVPRAKREAYVLVDPDTDVDTSKTYEFVGEATDCPGEEMPPFEFLKVTFQSTGDMGDSEDVSDLDVLNYALTLEHLEAAYYNDFLDEYSEHDVERSDAANVFADAGSRFSTYQKIQTVRDHEEAHVDALTQTIKDLDGTPVEPLEYEFPYDSVEEFAALSATIESVGVSAYAGAGPLIEDEDVLAAALSIHSVEARHTAYFRVLETKSPFPNAFDPARTMDEVLEIASQFIVGEKGNGATQRFTVTIENVSEPGTLDSDRAMGAVPLSPGAFAVYTGDNPAFTVGGNANAGTELVAEDGFPGGDLPGKLADELADAENVSDSGTFASPGGSLETPALGPGESASFTAEASPGDLLTLETMFVQSNDWFYGFDGLELFDDDEPISGDVTDELYLYDAGTEEDTAPGTGPDQKPVQDPMATDVGPDEDKPIELAADRHPDFDIPDAEKVINVTVSPE